MAVAEAVLLLSRLRRLASSARTRKVTFLTEDSTVQYSSHHHDVELKQMSVDWSMGAVEVVGRMKRSGWVYGGGAGAE